MNLFIKFQFAGMVNTGVHDAIFYSCFCRSNIYCIINDMRLHVNKHMSIYTCRYTSAEINNNYSSH